MTISPITFTLKDGRTATLRCADPENTADLQGLIDFITTAIKETPYLLRSPEECGRYTLEGEASFVRGNNDDPNALMLLCDVDGKVAGNCDIRFSSAIKTRHRGNIGIALRKEYWNLGIGTAMFKALEDFSRSLPNARQMELEFIEGNSRARALYEKMGFRITGLRPDAIMNADGTLVNEYQMVKKLS